MPKFKYDYNDELYVPNHGVGTVVDIRYDAIPNHNVTIYYKIEFGKSHERYWIEEQFYKRADNKLNRR